LFFHIDGMLIYVEMSGYAQFLNSHLHSVRIWNSTNPSTKQNLEPGQCQNYGGVRKDAQADG